MGSPSGIFVGLPLATLQKMQQAMIEGAVFGDVTSVSGGGKAESRNYSMSAEQRGIELNYAIALATGKPIPSKVVNVLARPYRGIL